MLQSRFLPDTHRGNKYIIISVVYVQELQIITATVNETIFNGRSLSHVNSEKHVTPEIFHS